MNQTPLHELWEPGFLPTTSLVSTADDCVLPLPGLAGTRLPVIQFVRVMMQTFHVADAISAGATLQCSQSWRQLLSEHSGFLPGYGYGCVFLEPASRSQRKPRFWSMALGSTLWELKSWMASLVLVVCKPLNTMKEIFWCFSELEIYSMQLNPDGCTILLITNCREKS